MKKQEIKTVESTEIVEILTVDEENWDNLEAEVVCEFDESDIDAFLSEVDEY